MRRRQRSRQNNPTLPNAARRSPLGNASTVSDNKLLISRIDSLLEEEDVGQEVIPVCPNCGKRHRSLF